MYWFNRSYCGLEIFWFPVLIDLSSFNHPLYHHKIGSRGAVHVAYQLRWSVKSFLRSLLRAINISTTQISSCLDPPLHHPFLPFIKRIQIRKVIELLYTKMCNFFNVGMETTRYKNSHKNLQQANR